MRANGLDDRIRIREPATEKAFPELSATGCHPLPVNQDVELTGVTGLELDLGT